MEPSCPLDLVDFFDVYRKWCQLLTIVYIEEHEKMIKKSTMTPALAVRKGTGLGIALMR